VARKDGARLDGLKRERCFSVDDERWCFTLPALHSFLRCQDEAFRRIEYKQFRRALFGSPIGQRLKPLGAEITIADNRGIVDKSSYALVWQDCPPPAGAAAGPSIRRV
jgi:hypothetical protein